MRWELVEGHKFVSVPTIPILYTGKRQKKKKKKKSLIFGDDYRKNLYYAFILMNIVLCIYDLYFYALQLQEKNLKKIKNKKTLKAV